MLGSMWRFVKRHRRKIFITGAVIGGAVLLGRYARSKLKEFQERETADYMSQIRKEHHFENNQRTFNTTVLSMIPSLREAVIKTINTEELTQLLKSKPDNKLDIWAELKVKSFTRMFVSVYSSCILIAVLRVRLNIIGGYMFVDHMANRNGLSHEHSMISEEMQKEYLQQIHYVLDEGLSDLVSATLKSTEQIVKDIDLRERLSPCDVEDIVRRVRHLMEVWPENGYSENSNMLCRFMMRRPRGQVEGAACREEIMLDRLNHETQDVIENGDFSAVLTLCLDRCFSLLVDRLTDHYDTLPRSNNPDQCDDPTLPMAKLIPVVDSMVHVVLADMPNPYVKEQLLMDQAKVLAANVYEAFSHMDMASVS